MRHMVFLSVAYAANTGGTGSLTGTGSNLILKVRSKSHMLELIGIKLDLCFAERPLRFCWQGHTNQFWELDVLRRACHVDQSVCLLDLVAVLVHRY